MLLEQQLFVFGVAGFARGFECLDLRQLRLVHGRHEYALGVVVVGGDARHHVGDDHAFDVLLIAQCVFDGENATPGVAEQEEVAGVEAEGDAHLLEFVDEPVDFPEVRLIGFVAIERAKLVVVDVFDASGGEIGIARLEIFVGGAGAAVQQQQARIRVVADAFGPHLELALGGGDGDATHTTCKRIIAAGVVEIRVDYGHLMLLRD